MKRIFVLLLPSYFLPARTEVNSNSNQAGIYAGKITAVTTVGHQVVDKMDDIVLYQGFVLEPRLTIINYSYNNVSGKGKVTPDAKSSRTTERLDGFILSSLKDSLCAIFDTTDAIPKKISFHDKHQGLVMKRDHRLLVQYLNSFVFYKDTLMNNRQFKIYICDFRGKPDAKGMERMFVTITKC